MSIERAPYRPIYWGDYARTSYETADDVPAIRKKLEAAFAAHNVRASSSSQHCCGYSCSVFSETLLEFEVGIFEEKTVPVTHTVEFRHMYGCRYDGSHFITKLGESVGMVFPGRPLPMGPPPLPFQEEPSEAAVLQMCDFVYDLISAGSPRSMVVQGLRSVSNMASSNPKRFSGPAYKLIAQTVLTLERFKEDDEMRMAAMCAIASMAKAVPDELLTAALEEGKLDENPHVRRLAR